MSIGRFIDAVKAGDLAQVRVLLGAQPSLVNTDVSGGDEHRGIHFAVLRHDLPMVRLLMEAGADARKGIYHHRDATSAWLLARDRGYVEVVSAIEDEERRRREEMSCPNATISPVQDRIVQAIRSGDSEGAIQLLDEDRSLIQACDRQGGTVLHVAAEEGNSGMVRWLLEHRAPVRKEDLNQLTALDRAALWLDAEEFAPIARLLLDAGADLTVRAAVALPDEDRVRELVEKNPNVLRKIDRGGGLVALAVRHGQLDMIRLLLDLGADVDEHTLVEGLEEPTPSWGSPLWHASREGNLAATRLLLDRGADPNSNVYASGWPLSNAWPHEDQSVRRLLLDRGARMQPYMVAELHNVEEAERLLADNPSEDTVHELLWSAAHHGCTAIVERTVSRVGWASNDERWHWILIQPARGAGSDSANNEGNFQSLALLLAHGADPNVARFGQTTLHFIAGYRGLIPGTDRARFAGLLLDHGAKIDQRDDLLESTPLGWAVRWGRSELVDLLLNRGASIEEAEAKPWAQPKAWAGRMENESMLARLERAS